METANNKIDELLEDEWYIVRNSGETPEIALHSAIYYLTVSIDGPRLNLNDEQIDWLRKAAVDRFQDIIVRDLQHANYGKPEYRGIGRSIINYRRFCTFCERQKISHSILRKSTAAALLNFLEIEVAEVEQRQRPTIVSCSYGTLKSFAADLGIDVDSRFPELGALCSAAE